VDYVTIFEEPTPLALIQVLRPDVLVKGADYRKENVIGADVVEAYGGRVHLAAVREGYSTTRLLARWEAAWSTCRRSRCSCPIGSAMPSWRRRPCAPCAATSPTRT